MTRTTKQLRWQLAVVLLLSACAAEPSSREAGPSPTEPLADEVSTVAPTITNPFIRQRADPHIFKHADGTYYFIATVPSYDKLELRASRTLEGLPAASAKVIWTRHTTGVMANHIWAPEIHHIDGKWYIYFAAGSQADPWAIRMYVLENASADPLQGRWTEKGQIVTDWQSFALDATTFEHRGTRYLVWAQADPAIKNNSNLYIARMINPWTIQRRAVRLSKPDLGWERVGFAVNEGPAVLKKGGKIFISYSASATDANYCLGLLTADENSDLLSPSSWKKASSPVFKSGNGVYGPGHNTFTTTPDGKVDLLVYHGRDYREINGDPLNDPNRHTRIQPLSFDAQGVPVFGAPAKNGKLVLGGSGPAL
jgi:GH43 family beta-xylosidase